MEKDKDKDKITVIENPQEEKHSNDSDIPHHTDNSYTFRNIWNWFIQILMWVMIWTLFKDVIELDLNMNNHLVTLIVYLIYVLNNTYFSSTSALLDNIVDINNLKEHLKSVFTKRISKKIKITNHHTDFLSNKKKITSSEEVEFEYLSWRDTSGMLEIKYNPGEEIKPFLGINLSYKLQFEDSSTESDYIILKEEIIKRNIGKDTNYTIEEKENIENFEDYILVKMIDKEDPLLNSTLYFVFVLFIPIVELYKLYFKSLCKYKSYKIVKTVSTKNKIHLPEFDNKFLGRDPIILIQGKDPITFEDFKFKEGLNLSTTIINNQDVILTTKEEQKIKENFDNENNLSEPLIKQQS